MKLSVGPVLFFWQRDAVYQFYRELAEQPVDVIYLGETVCSKRRELKTQEWIDLGRELSAQGKQVVLSSLALIEAESELKTLRRLCDNGDLWVEANDMGAVEMLSERKLPFVSGPAINVYNAYSLETLFKRGMRRWVMPVELSGETLKAILSDAQAMGFADQIETEVFSHGLLPLAYSARCFSARAHNLPKDDCRLTCLAYPQGMPLHSQENQTLFTINGIQTLSGHTYNLLGEIDEMEQMGVSLVRLSPGSRAFSEVITKYRAGIEGRLDEITVIPTETVNGYWYNNAGINQVAKNVSADPAAS